MSGQVVTYAQVQELVMRVPIQRLPIAYRLLADPSESEANTSSPQREFMLLSRTQRRRLLAEQAKQMTAH